jgi:hypothetical protein
MNRPILKLLLSLRREGMQADAEQRLHLLRGDWIAGTPPSSTTSATASASDSPNGPTRTRGNGRYAKSSAFTRL